MRKIRDLKSNEMGAVAAVVSAVAAVLLAAVPATWVVARQFNSLEDRVDAVTQNVLNAFPPGAILVSHTSVNPTLEYGEGWVRCGEAPGTPVLDDRLLVGAAQSNVGQMVGSPAHTHQVAGRTGGEAAGRNLESPPETADNYSGTNWQHQHDFEVISVPADNLPLAHTVLFLCRVANHP